MRKLSEYTSSEEASQVAAFLGVHTIEAKADGKVVWVVNDDDLENARQLAKDFSPPKKISKNKKANFRFKFSVKKKTLPLKPTPITLWTLILCVLIFLVTSAQMAKVYKSNGELALNVGLSPLQRELMFDFPNSSQELSDVIREYPVKSLDSIKNLSGAKRDAYEEALALPRWEGVYSYLINWKRGAPVEILPSSFAEKIQSGQVWRFFTPALLHAGILHILFNMLWLWHLGREMEQRIGSGNLAVFMLTAAAFSNLSQYVMSGPYFLGFSGVVCAMLGFIWMREKIAPWEGYSVQRPTFLLVGLFLFALFALQLVAFITQFFNLGTFSPGIANTAHVSGALAGLFLARMPQFNGVKK